MILLALGQDVACEELEFLGEMGGKRNTPAPIRTEYASQEPPPMREDGTKEMWVAPQLSVVWESR